MQKPSEETNTYILCWTILKHSYANIHITLYSLGFPRQGQGPTQGCGGHRNQRAAAVATCPVFWVTFHRGNRGWVGRDQLHVPRIHSLRRRLLDHRSRFDLCWSRRMVRQRPRTSLELGVLRVVVEEKAAGVGVMVMVVMVSMMLLYPDVPQVPVLADELVHPPVQLLYPGALRLDETLLVLDDGGELSQVQNRLHRVFQQAGAHHTQDKRGERRRRKKRSWTDGWRAEEMQNIRECG